MLTHQACGHLKACFQVWSPVKSPTPSRAKSFLGTIRHEYWWNLLFNTLRECTHLETGITIVCLFESVLNHQLSWSLVLRFRIGLPKKLRWCTLVFGIKVVGDDSGFVFISIPSFIFSLQPARHHVHRVQPLADTALPNFGAPLREAMNASLRSTRSFINSFFETSADIPRIPSRELAILAVVLRCSLIEHYLRACFVADRADIRLMVLSPLVWRVVYATDGHLLRSIVLAVYSIDNDHVRWPPYYSTIDIEQW